MHSDEEEQQYYESDGGDEYHQTGEEEEEDVNNDDDSDGDGYDEVEEMKELTFEQRLQLLQREQAEKKRQKHIQEMEKMRQQRMAARQKQREGNDGSGDDDEKPTEIKKKNKNAPRELSTKVKVPKIPNVTQKYQRVKQIARDPRFDDISGQTLDQASAKRSVNNKYGFVREMQQQEIEEYKTALKDHSLDPDSKKEIQRKLNRLVTKTKRFEHDRLVEDVRKEFYENEKKLVAEKGKKPYFLKDSDLKKLVAKRKREELSGAKLDKHIKKNRLKQKSKQHRMMPTQSGNRGT